MQQGLGFIPMPHTVKVRKAVGEDEWGYPAHEAEDSSISYPAKITFNQLNEEITVASGEVLRYTARILIDGRPPVTYNDLITFEGYEGQVISKTPVEIIQRADLGGNPIALRVTV